MHRQAPKFDSGIGRAAWMLVIGVTLARVMYLLLLCPYELAADEAQYWDWSRPQHIDLSYYSKGPGIAWLIAASTRVFGDSEWAIRLPAALSMGIAMLTVSALAARARPDLRAAPFAAALAFCCIPAYHATAILMTIDAPYIACWTLAALAAWSLRERPTTLRWLALAASLGVGFLFKYTILLLVPGLVIWAVVERAKPRSILGPLLSLAVFSLIVSPVFIWNSRHDWPTLAHLLGHIGATGGDLPTSGSPRTYDPRWTLEFIATQLGLVGPIAALFIMSIINAHTQRSTDPASWRAARFAMATSLPILLFYFAVSFTSDVEGNWPIAGYTTLIIPVAIAAAQELMSAHRHFRAAWHWSIGFGACAFVALFALNLLDRVPYLTDVIPYHRISGHRAYAERIAAVSDRPDRLFIADQYTRAALMAYYLPGRPAVRSATSFLGGRRSSYDYFPDTSLRDPALLSRPAVLIGSTPEKWRRSFRFDAVEQRIEGEPKRPAVYLGENFGGPITP